MTKTIKKSPFTIIELMIVLLILGLMATIAMVKLDNLLPSLKMDSESRKLAGLISHLYDSSISTGKVYALRYNSTENFYEVRLVWNEKKEDGVELPEEAQQLSGRTYLPEGIRFKEVNDDFGSSIPRNGDKMEVRFDPSGFITPHRIHLIDAKDREITLEVLFLTGQVIFHNEYYEPGVTLERVVPQ